jgi:hypothetical protein
MSTETAAPTGYRVPTATGERAEIHCETCGHPVNVRRAGACIIRGHVVTHVRLEVTTFNAERARPFTAEPVPYLGSSR